MSEQDSDSKEDPGGAQHNAFSSRENATPSGPDPPTSDNTGPHDADAELDSEPRVTRLSFSVMDSEFLAPIFFTGLFLATTGALFYVLSSFLADAVVAFILLGLFKRPYQFLLARVRFNRWVASGVMTLLIVVVLLLPLAGFLYAVTVEAALAFDSLAYLFEDGGRSLIEQTILWVESHGFRVTHGALTEYIQRLAMSLNEVVVSLGGALFGNVLYVTIHAATVMVMIFYLFADGERLRDFVFKLSPLPDHEDALLVETFQKVARGVVIGNGLGSAIQGALGGLALWAVGLPSPLLWGAVMTVFAFLPLIGVTIVVIPATIVLAFQGRTTEAIAFLAFCTVMATFVENIVKTKLMGSAMRMHDLLVFLSIIGGIAAFGVIGFVYGPLIAMLFMTLHGLYETHYLPHIAHSFGGGLLGVPRATWFRGPPSYGPQVPSSKGAPPSRR